MGLPRSREDAREDTHRRQPDGANNQERENEAQEHQLAAKERTAISVHVVYEAILAEGEAELKRPTSALAFSGLAAGLSMGFSFLTQGFLKAALPSGPNYALLAKLGYSVGFLMIILGRQQLFTENTLTPIIPLLKHKRWVTLRDTLRLWAAVFLANWLGTMLFAWVVAHAGVIPQHAQPTFLEVARQAMPSAFGQGIINGIFAGWVIALLVWLLPFAESARVGVIILMTYVIALAGFNHVVAGSVDTFYLVVIGETGWAQYLGRFMAPTLIGNIVGGVALVAVLNHAQVTAGSAEGA